MYTKRYPHHSLLRREHVLVLPLLLSVLPLLLLGSIHSSFQLVSSFGILPTSIPVRQSGLSTCSNTYTALFQEKQQDQEQKKTVVITG